MAILQDLPAGLAPLSREEPAEKLYGFDRVERLKHQNQTLEVKNGTHPSSIIHHPSFIIHHSSSFLLHCLFFSLNSESMSKIDPSI